MQGSSKFLIDFIQLAGPFWSSENKSVIRIQTLSLIVLTILQIVVAVIITEWTAALYNALEQRSMTGLLIQVGLLILIFFASMAITGTHMVVKRHLQIGWRNWLTERVIGQWMSKGRHYQVTHIQGEHDNPDGRIAEDIRIATEEAIALSHSLFYSLLLLFSFTKILWTLSGTVMLDLGIVVIPIYGHLVWIALIYATGASFLGWLIGKPLIKATDAKQTAEANFRYRLVRERENSLAIALVHGENKEQKRLQVLFQDIIDTWQQQTHAWTHIQLFTSGYSVLSMAFPILVSSPRYILGSISLGALVQSAQSFQHMASALSWPVGNMAGVAKWSASVERVLGLSKALDTLEQEINRPDPQRITLERSDDSILRLSNLSIIRLDGIVVKANINDEVKPGERVLVTGNSFTANKLFKAIAGLWPWGEGRIELPDEEPMFFMPPRPYLPSGTLRAAICYPSSPEEFSPNDLEVAIELAGLKELLDQLDHKDTWETALSREQQQRLGLVRLLLHKPQWVMIQESFDSLDPEGEETMLKLICQKLPDAALLTITKQPTAEKFHQRQIKL
jgi:vitamin B12/bleomycin/antimicrobial peptide transport system ATP-binding/permease protein